MNVVLTDMPQRFAELYTMDINGNTLYYNPLGFGGVTVVDSAMAEMIGLCDGLCNIIDIAKVVGRAPESVLEDFQTLAEREVVSISSEFTDGLHSFTRRRLFTGWLHLTNKCNLDCEYCFVKKTPVDMNQNTARMAIDSLFGLCAQHGFGALKIKFSGGEPLMRFDDLREIVSYAESSKGDIATSYLLLTNSTLVTDEIAKYLALYRFGVGTSLDGLGPVHDRYRHNRAGVGSFEATWEGIETLRSHGVEPSINITVTDANYSHLQELTCFLLDHELKFRFSLQRDTKSGAPAVLQYELGVIDELMACYDLIESRLPATDITRLHKFGDVVFSRPTIKSCGAGSNSIAINHDGGISVCGPGISLTKGSLFDEGDLYGNIRCNNTEFLARNAWDYEECSGCFWRSSCAGSCPLQTYSTYGRYDVRSPYCSIYKAVLPRILRIKGLQMIREFKERERDRRCAMILTDDMPDGRFACECTDTSGEDTVDEDCPESDGGIS